jgi:hypothetical protein
MMPFVHASIVKMRLRVLSIDSLCSAKVTEFGMG